MALAENYRLDELGSPLRVSGYGAGKKADDIGNEYLTYGYDEFGSDLYKELEGAGIPCPYDRQGEEQPFGYTGYRFDDVSGTYFAQAREYRAENGRFTAEDVIKGNGAAPETLNRYGYCWGNPVMLVDKDGKFPWIVIPIMFAAALTLEGCSQPDEDEIELVVLPIEPIEPTPTAPISATPSPVAPSATPNVPSYENTNSGKIISDLSDYKIEERAELIEFIKKTETFQESKYRASSNESYYTIGYGHLCDDPTGSDAKYLVAGYKMTSEEATELLLNDLKEHIPDDILKVVYGNGIKLFDYQIDALTSLGFNEKEFNCQRSPNFTSYLQNGNYDEAETFDNLMTYIKSGGNILPGLVKRRVAEAMIFAGYGYPVIKGDNFYDDKELMLVLYDYAKQFNEERAEYCLK